MNFTTLGEDTQIAPVTKIPEIVDFRYVNCAFEPVVVYGDPRALPSAKAALVNYPINSENSPRNLLAAFADTPPEFEIREGVNVNYAILKGYRDAVSSFRKFINDNHVGNGNYALPRHACIMVPLKGEIEYRDHDLLYYKLTTLEDPVEFLRFLRYYPATAIKTASGASPVTSIFNEGGEGAMIPQDVGLFINLLREYFFTKAFLTSQAAYQLDLPTVGAHLQNLVNNAMVTKLLNEIWFNPGEHKLFLGGAFAYQANSSDEALTYVKKSRFCNRCLTNSKGELNAMIPYNDYKLMDSQLSEKRIAGRWIPLDFTYNDKIELTKIVLICAGVYQNKAAELAASFSTLANTSMERRITAIDIDPRFNMFLQYDPISSERIGKPVFKNTAQAPLFTAKPNLLPARIVNETFSLKSFQMAPKTLAQFKRQATSYGLASQYNVNIGGGKAKNSNWPLVLGALAAAGIGIYSFTKG